MAIPAMIGPILFARGGDRSESHVSAVLLSSRNEPPPLRTTDGAAVLPAEIDALYGHSVWRYDFALPTGGEAGYDVGGNRYAVAAGLPNARRIAYVSCNGQEHADDKRPLDGRNRMWRRLADEHARAPFSLMLHGGDQLYADEVLKSHPTLVAWAGSDVEEKGDHRFTEEVEDAAGRYLFRRYAELYSQPDIAPLIARIPSIMMWDDHDIIDGWGSHDSAMLDSEVGRGLFKVCRRMFMLFQLGASDSHPSPLGNQRVAGGSLGFCVGFPDFDIVVPDLRSERRPDRVMGPAGWSATERALDSPPSGRRRFLMSSVPLLGPRLSWVEALIRIVPKLRRYEDDLRDQWQSRAHRDEWRRMLKLLDRTTPDDCGLTVLSGEIHLATRGEMPMASGGVMRQLVASGIAHPPPPSLYARALGWLAALGEDPLLGRKISLRPLPGQRQIYMAERNFLILERQGDDWSAVWELEDSGRTPALPI